MSSRRHTWTNFAIGLLLSFPSSTAAIPQISLSNTPQQCSQTIVTISGGTPPFTFSILVPADGPTGAHFETFASTSSTSATWDGRLAGGKTSQFQVTDASGARGNTHPFTVLASDDDSCLGGSQPPPPTTTTTTALPPPPPPTATTTSPTRASTSDSHPDPPTSTSPSNPGTSASPPDPSSTNRSIDPGSSPTTSAGSAPSVTSNPPSNPNGSSTTVPSGTPIASGQTPSGTFSGTDTSRTSGSMSSASGSLPAPTIQSPGSPSGPSINIALIVGIIVAVLAVVLVALCVLYIRRRRRTLPFVIKQYPAEDPEGRNSTTHSLLLSELSPKTSMKQGHTHSFTQASLSPSYPASIEENSSVLYLHPHALDSIIAEPTVVDMTPRQDPTATRDQSTRNHDIKDSTITSPSSSEKRSEPTGRRSESLSPSPVETPSTAPTQSLPHSTPRYHATPPSTYSEEPRGGNASRRTSEAQRPIVYELDGGVCLAGGPPGGARGNTQDAPGVAMTLPPPYRMY